jgi:YHS domain-containing protein
MLSRRKLFPIIATALCVLASVPFFSGNLFAKGQEPAREHGLVQVEAKYVCMVNNQRFDKEQIAVKVKERTYYGCCEMCKEKRRSNAKSRVAIDPVSGKEVDKATAVIGASPDGKVFYFENLDNLKQFKLD